MEVHCLLPRGVPGRPGCATLQPGEVNKEYVCYVFNMNGHAIELTHTLLQLRRCVRSHREVSGQGAQFPEEPDEGRMKSLAFALDPDD